jgi:protein-disulfide isomerase
VSLDGSPQKGSSVAAAVLIVYSDFQCPYCGTFARDTLTQIEESYVEKGTLRVAFRNMPLSKIHPLAIMAAEGGICAGRQGRFWQWHDALFRGEAVLERDAFSRIASDVGVNLADFKRCLDQGDASRQVQRESEEAMALGVRSTPTFIVGTGEEDGRVKPVAMLRGARPFADFKRVLDNMVARPATR